MTTATILRQLAEQYLALGLPPVPIFKGRPTVLWQPYQHRLPTTEEIEQWRWEAADGLGLVLGHPNPHGKHWWVWDIEAPYREQAERWLDENHPHWREGLVAQSQRGGLHVYCLSQQPVRTQKHPFGDIKGLGSLIFAPPTRRFKPDASGDYLWVSFQPEKALQLEPADLPWPSDNGHQGVLGREPLREVLQRTIPKGTRNVTLTRIAGLLRGQLDLPPDEVLTILRVLNDSHCEEPLPDEELQAISRSSSKWPANPTLVVSNGKDDFVSPTIERGVGESNSTPDSWLPIPIGELDTGTTTATEWLWDGFLAKGHVTDFYGFWKSGKSTLVTALLQRMEHGGELAGREVRPGKALVISEESRTKWIERREALGLADHVHIISRPFPKRPNHAEWHTFTSHITRLVTEHGYDLVVFDSLPNLWPVRDENDASETVSALLPLQAIATAGCAVLFLRHPRKSDGLEATAGRGSGAIAGFADIIIEMRRYVPGDLQDTRRVLTVYSRYEPFETVVKWTGDGQYESLGSPETYSVEAQRERLLQALAELGTATTSELAKAVELPHGTVSRRLSELEAAGLVVRTGSGKRGSPFRWSLASGDDPDGDDFVSPTKAPVVGETKTGGIHENPHQSCEIGGHGSVDFVSPTNTPAVGETKTDGKPENPHQSCEIGGHGPGGAAFVSPTKVPIVGEKKLDGETENPHQNYEIGGQTPVREAGAVNDVVNEPENPHQNYEIGGQTAVREAGETELSHREAKNGGHGCVVCGKPVAHWGGKPARFCGDACRKKAQRQRQSSADTPGQGEPVPPAVEVADSGPPDPSVCLDCGKPITDPGFSYRCPRCLKTRLDRFARPYPEKLMDWVQQQGGRSLVEQGTDDIIEWGERLLAELRAGRVQLPVVEIKPGHAVLVLEQFLESHIAEAKLGIGAATKNLQLLQRALELVSEKQQQHGR
jgi:DNA-binding transcriptional ArsR family regulator